ncbi:hypothetical protein L218DRAFT_947767 [Marasmius fiardii PR-910]|nr:hypothetical protein L218DRAFT_947767 [Marasmius fiardii PR-910]
MFLELFTLISFGILSMSPLGVISNALPDTPGLPVNYTTFLATEPGTFKQLVGIGTYDPNEPAPTQCQKLCADTPSAGRACSQDTLQCLCTDKWVSSYASCLDCTVAFDTTVRVADAQAFMDTFTASCQDGGFNVRSQTIIPNKNGAGPSAGSASLSMVVVSVISATVALGMIGGG